MGLNIDPITLSEYRLTQNPVWQDVLANAIAEGIFEDGAFDADEVLDVRNFMRQLDTKKRKHLEGVIRFETTVALRKKFFRNIVAEKRLDNQKKNFQFKSQPANVNQSLIMILITMWRGL